MKTQERSYTSVLSIRQKMIHESNNLFDFFVVNRCERWYVDFTQFILLSFSQFNLPYNQITLQLNKQKETQVYQGAFLRDFACPNTLKRAKTVRVLLQMTPDIFFQRHFQRHVQTRLQ
ncbi:Hypothetical_protein [Hexamita inflata]|uniref:Hypothetical_protein n=1 Tax=Hexamita inflata TaxID=28002 RepID=A0AA86U3W9_9EUKA|nr:Hypothetical protein HINF_LOCUS27329 [Hexamita inflata]